MTDRIIPNLRYRVPLLGAQVSVLQASPQGWREDRRPSRHVRGYGTEWDKLRLRILERDRYLCQCKDCKGGEIRTRPASEVDHIVSKAEWQVLHGSLDGVDADANLQAINALCHRRKTDEDRKRAYGRQRGGVVG